MWSYIKGQPAFNGDLFNQCLKLDGVNDYLNLPANSFYQVGTSAFSFVVRFQHITDYGTGKSLLRTSNNINLPRFLINLEGSDNTIKIRFISQKHIDAGQSNVGDLITYDLSSIPPYQWNTMIVIRRGNNFSSSSDVTNYPNSIRNSNNIELWVNGIKLTRLSVNMLEIDGLQYQVDSNDNFTVGGLTSTSTSFFNGYLDFFAYYNRALSNEDIAEATQGRFTDEMAKGIWNFTGNTNDDSSVGNPMSLFNNVDPSYITWSKTSGVFVFKANIAQQFTRIFPNEVKLTAVYKSQPYTYMYSLDNGTTWTQLPSVSGTNTALNITIPAGTQFIIRDNNQRSLVGLLHFTF